MRIHRYFSTLSVSFSHSLSITRLWSHRSIRFTLPWERNPVSRRVLRAEMFRSDVTKSLENARQRRAFPTHTQYFSPSHSFPLFTYPCVGPPKRSGASIREDPNRCFRDSGTRLVTRSLLLKTRQARSKQTSVRPPRKSTDLRFPDESSETSSIRRRHG